MTATDPSGLLRARRRSPRAIAILVGLALLATSFLAFELGRRRPQVHTETVACLSADGVISCGHVDDPNRPFITVPLDVRWTGIDGIRRSSGRPDCLPPVGIGTIEVSLTWVNAHWDGGSDESVVSVTCLS